MQIRNFFPERGRKIGSRNETGENREGLLVRIKGSDYFVISEGEEYGCYLRGRFRIDGGQGLPVVGDRVQFRMNRGEGTGERSGLIMSIRKRSSIFARSVSGGRKKKVLGANLDYVFLVHAVRNPDLNTRLIDRMIVAAEFGGIEPVICINKTDLAPGSDRLDRAAGIYGKAGYRFISCSARNGTGLEPLLEMMKGKISLMAGPSGAGKTTIISAIQPGLDIRTGEVSARTGKGKHTTSHLELHPLSGGGYLGDTPGIRGFGVELVEKNSLKDYFVEFRQYNDMCRFKTCVHDSEPGCAVKQAVGDGIIAEERYSSYLRMLEEIQQQESRY